MAKRIKVSTIGAPPPPLIPDTDNRRQLELMRDYWRGKLERVLSDRPDLIVLPEFSDLYSGHSSEERRAYLCSAGDAMLDFYRESAQRNQCHISYPTMCRAKDGAWRNRVRMIDRNGQVIGHYDKYHLTIGEIEELDIKSETKPRIIDCELGRIACVTCFDLNFDELRTHYAAARPDLILFSSLYHGGLMQAYWAYSCRAHFVSCIGHRGLYSAIISPVGGTLASSTVYQEFATATINLDCRVAHYDYNGGKFAALKARYGPGVTILDPDLLGSVLISSESEERSALEMIREFDIELLDDYLARSSECQRGSRLPGD